MRNLKWIVISILCLFTTEGKKEETIGLPVKLLLKKFNDDDDDDEPIIMTKVDIVIENPPLSSSVTLSNDEHIILELSIIGKWGIRLPNLKNRPSS